MFLVAKPAWPALFVFFNVDMSRIEHSAMAHIALLVASPFKSKMKKQIVKENSRINSKIKNRPLIFLVNIQYPPTKPPAITAVKLKISPSLFNKKLDTYSIGRSKPSTKPRNEFISSHLPERAKYFAIYQIIGVRLDRSYHLRSEIHAICDPRRAPWAEPAGLTVVRFAA